MLQPWYVFHWYRTFQILTSFRQSELRILQTRVLLVEYAAWKSSKHLRRWAIKEKEAAKDVCVLPLSPYFPY